MADGVASGWIHDALHVGDAVLVDSPYGTFVGDPATETPVVCLAAGSGLAPILSLTDGALRRGFPHPVTLVVSARTEEDEISVGMMRWWERKYPNFRLVVVHTRADTLGHDVGERLPGRLPELIGDLTGTSVFIAGSPGFVYDCEESARALGADLVYTEGHTSQVLPADL